MKFRYGRWELARDASRVLVLSCLGGILGLATITGCVARCRPGTVREGDHCVPVNTELHDAADDGVSVGATTKGAVTARAGAEAAAADSSSDPPVSSAVAGAGNVAGAPTSAPEAAGTGADGVAAAGAGGMSPDSPMSAQSAGSAAPDSSASDDDMKEAAMLIACGDGKVEGDELCDGDCPTPAQCQTEESCVTTTVVGSASTCDAQCEFAPIVTCVPGDGCCPSGCTYPSDTDCSPSCGDGVLTAGETCEPDSSEHTCPMASDCDDGDACTDDKLMGSAQQCSAQCVSLPITRPAGGDMCCPRGANANNDSDCAPKCGNGVVESGETCDGNCPRACSGGSGCRQQTLMGSVEACTAKCVSITVTSRQDGDGCCPQGANATNDSDCPGCRSASDCEAGELCRQGKCECSGVPSSTNREHCGTCGNTCAANEECINGKCQEEPCGNGTVDSGEECDPIARGWNSSTCNPDTCKRTVYTACNSDADCQFPGSYCLTVPNPQKSGVIYFCSPSCARGVGSCPTIPSVSGGQYMCAGESGSEFCGIKCESTADCPSGLDCYLGPDYGLCAHEL